MIKAPMIERNHQFASLVQAVLDNTPSVIYVKDSEFRYLLINRQFETLFHVSREEILGKTDFDIFPRELAEGFRVNDRRVFESGESLQCEEFAPQDDGLHNYFSLKFPLRDTNNKIYAIAGISRDITDRIRDQRVIASLLHREHLILDSVDDGICVLDEAGRIAFLNHAGERMLQWTAAELRGQCHSQIAMQRLPMEWVDQSRQPSLAMPNHNGKPTSNIQSGKFRRRDGSVIPVEYTIVPIHHTQAVVGAVVAFRDTTERIKQLAIEQEVQTARRIQESLSPKRVPAIPGFDFAAISIPCSKGCGDYHDFIELGDGRLGIAVGDVSGHGLGAALQMVETRAILRTTMLSESNPVFCLTRLNEILSADLPDDMFVTLFLATLDVKERTLTYAAAGHDAFLLCADGELRRLKSTGTVLGWTPSAIFSSGAVLTLRSGDVLLIVTDGIAESVSPSGHVFGRERVVSLLRQYQSSSADEILSALQCAAAAFREYEPQRDDVTAVVVKVR